MAMAFRASRLILLIIIIITFLCLSTLSQCRNTLHKSRTPTSELSNNALWNSRLPSGPSPGVGNSVPSSFISNRLSLGKHKNQLINSRLSLSSPSPGVGHAYKLNTHFNSKAARSGDASSISGGLYSVFKPDMHLKKKMVRGSTFHNAIASLIASRLPSGPSPGSGNSFSPLSHTKDTKTTISNRLSLARGRHHHRLSHSNLHHDMA